MHSNQLTLGALSKTFVPIIQYRAQFHEDICSWVASGHELMWISDDEGEVLTKKIIDRWIQNSLGAFVLSIDHKVIAFATLSCSEWTLPEGTCEVCHLIVAPLYRRQYHASFFVNWLDRLALTSGFTDLVGRVQPGNLPALRLMDYLRWHEITGKKEWAAGDFLWYRGPARVWR